METHKKWEFHDANGILSILDNTHTDRSEPW